MGYLELLLRPDLGKRPYRLRCRFTTHPNPSRDFLDREKVKVAERFIADMAAQGWDFLGQYGVRLTGPFVPVQPVTIRRPRTLRARDMLDGVAQGARFLAGGPETRAQQVAPFGETEYWEYELAAVFLHGTILTERPDAHEVAHA